jgi:hypothetical protein
VIGLVAVLGGLGGLALPAASVSAAARQPSIVAVSPLAGSPSGGTVTIRGTSLDRVTAVSFGGVRSRKITHTSPAQISVVVPAHPAGPVAVHLIARVVRGADSAEYRYAPPPTQLHWSRDHTIDPDVGDLAGLSCPTRTFCVSVEASDTAPALLTFAPHGRVHRTAFPGDKALPAVSCSSPTMCFALNRGTVSRWNGRQWSRFRRIAAPRAELDRLSCVTGTRFCLALGDAGATWVHRAAGWTPASRLHRTVYESTLSCVRTNFCMLADGGRAFRFDGNTWQRASRGLPSYLKYETPAFTCASPTFCLLASEYGTFRWTGSRWRSAGFQSTGFGDALGCASRRLCVLTGENGTSEWRAGQWHDADAIGPPVDFPAISCPASRECLATVRSGVAIRRPTGWSTHYIELSGGDLSDVSCATTAWCMAVDSYGNAVRRAAGMWHRPRAIDRRRELSSVSCAGRDFCAAVDGADPYDRETTPGVGHAVVYRHGRWQSPRVIDARFGLTDVACASPRVCFAVDDGGYVLRWNGRRWSPPRRVGALLEAVACPTTSRCIAVGRRSAQWQGGRWRVLRNPAGSKQLTDVTCTDAHYCVMGGGGGFYVRHAGVWSGAIRPGGNLWQVQVACTSRSACYGSQDNQVDVWDYTFDGSRVAPSADEIYGPKMSCGRDGCVSVSLSYAEYGRPVA